jgi:GT2 family glycosyltransferase
MRGVARILAVIVLYGDGRKTSATLRSVEAALSRSPGVAALYEFLLWDNSAVPLDRMPSFAHYRHDPTNSGTSGAGNGAAAYATGHGLRWMMMLDQDTTLPADFLERMHAQAMRRDSDPTVSAIAPTVLVGDFVVSPRRMLRNRHVAYPSGENGLAPGEAASINSGTLLRVSDLLAVGGYDPRFWLDYSDWALFHQFYRAGLGTWRAADIVLHHSMTVMDYDNLMDSRRYKNLLDAEEAYTDLYRGGLEGAMQTARLLLRSVKQRLKFRDPIYSRMSVARFLRRLVTTRRYRVRMWESSLPAAIRHTKGRGGATA